MAKRSKTVFATFQKGDPSACRDVQAWVTKEVRKYACGRRDLQNDQEDLCQEILSKLSDPRRHDPAKIRDLGAYIYIVAKTTCIDFLDKHQREHAWRRGLGRERPSQPEPPARMDSDNSADVVPPERERLLRMLTASLEYIDVAYRIRSTYREDIKKYHRTIKPYLEAKEAMRKTVPGLILGARLPAAEKDSIFGPLTVGLYDTLQRLDQEIRSKTWTLSFTAGDPDWPLDFNEFIGEEIVKMRLRPATLIFRVWSKIIKKPGPGRYANYSFMSNYYSELQKLYKGTDKDYLFKGSFNPKALRVEAHKRSKMKPFYDRLAEYFYQKALQELSLDEAIEKEISHVPPFRKRGRMVLPLSDK